MIGINKLNIQWEDDNHCHVQDPNTGHEFNVTVRNKELKFAPNGQPVKPRLYIGGAMVNTKQDVLGHHQAIAWAKDYFGPVLNKILNREVELKFSAKAGCSCGCSPGFIVQDNSFSFDIWMDALEK